MSYKYMLTCGHNSNDGKCPHGCPDSEVLHDLKSEPEPELVAETVEEPKNGE